MANFANNFKLYENLPFPSYAQHEFQIKIPAIRKVQCFSNLELQSTLFALIPLFAYLKVLYFFLRKRSYLFFL